MALFLVQHGKNLPKDVDPEKGLSDEGKGEVIQIARVARGYKVSPKRIVHSGKKRAHETARIFAEELGIKDVAEEDGLGPVDDVAAYSEKVSAGDDLMIVGHLPFMERICAYLITGKPEPPVFQFQNGGVVCMDEHFDKGTWVIKWALMPNIA
ncbi:MAG: phosphohistidine phosphatase SixA [Desulfatibacillaceae bacterium]